MAELVISNEQQAWDLLDSFVYDKLLEDISSITLVNWPVFELKLYGEKYNSSITPRLMEAFVEVQKNINRAYAKLYYGKPNSRFLSDEEKAALEIVVRVSPGSSGFQIDLQAALEKFIQGAVHKMQAKHILGASLIVGLVWGGTTSFNSYLEHERQIKQLDLQKYSQELELRRMQLLADALEKQSEIKPVVLEAGDVYNSILKGSARADRLQVAGKDITRDEIKQLVRPTRTRSNQVQLNGMCRILKVDSSKPDHFKVEVKFEDGRIFTARLEESFISTREANKKLIQEAEWGHKEIFLIMNANELRGEISQATIIDVKDRYMK